MAIGPKTQIGLDLGHGTITAVQLERNGTGYRVVRSGSVPTPPDSIRDGVVTDPEAVGGAIKTLLRESHIHGGQAIIAASGGSVFVRQVSYPKMPATMVRDSLRYEAGRFIPGSVEDSFVEAEIVAEGDDTSMTLLLVAAPKDLVASRISACLSAGLTVHEVDLEAFATYRTLIEMDGHRDLRDKTIAFVDLGYSKTGVSIVRDGQFIMHRTITGGGRSMSEALMKYFEISEQDAEDGKALLDVSDLLSSRPEENPPLRVLQTMLDDMVRELKRSFNYFATQGQSGGQGAAQSGGTNPAPNAPQSAEDAGRVDIVFLVGGGAQLKGLAQYIEAKTGIPCSEIGAYDNPAITHNDLHEASGVDLTVAVGLALRQFVVRPSTKAAKGGKTKSSPRAKAA